jgi:CO dehydrogenase/acetyl-CoA synthase alpha subunit
MSGPSVIVVGKVPGILLIVVAEGEDEAEKTVVSDIAENISADAIIMLTILFVFFMIKSPFKYNNV